MSKFVSPNTLFSRLVRHWHQNLSFRLSFSFLAIFGLLVASSVTMIYTVQRTLLIEQGEDHTEQIGLRVVSDLNALILEAQNQTRVMADLAKVLDPDIQTYQKLFGQIVIPSDMKDVVAGGGIWPEPFAFDPKVERNSFFWGMQPNGTLKYYDDYNNPQGPGYHQEHWYIPGRYYPPSSAIWSHSYTDPYSLQPMVTCTVPIYKDESFNGVATIDLKLDGLNQSLRKDAQSTGGYMFVVDRESRFVAFPHMDMVRTEQPDEAGNLSTQYLQLKDVTQTLPGMSRIRELHDEMNIRMIQNAQQNMANFSQRVNELHRKYPTLSQEQTQILIASMFDQTRIKAVNPRKVRRMRLERMPLMDEPCMVSVFHMPRTYWNVVMVVPVSTFIKPADKASLKLALWFVGLELLTMLVLLVVTRRILLNKAIRNTEHDVVLNWDQAENRAIEEDMLSIQSKMEHIRQLVRPVLPSNSGNNQAMCVNTDVQRMIDDILAIDAEDIQNQQVQVRVNVAIKQLLKLDAYRLAQALTNIITNARHALAMVESSQRRLHIAAQLIDDSILQITIHDTGCGIDPQQLPNIFDNGYTTRPSARGVGLHSAAMAVRELGGSINAHSDGKNKGSIFTLSIPVQLNAAPSLTPADI
ncbi:MAG TPA: hypothetical protein DCM28_12335 [Phycisphaerales bacterium]|nr:hypothetical protein [Phycisphaerales bacterium]HCD34767.1 hypothetical protein [Phycisphaerales bacterium]|tara:strand:+ start:2570 stop:4483 length:1914 start_codon:yes stop_codon:yes gene_type:complete